MAETAVFGPFVLDRRKRVLTRNGEPVPIGHRGYVLLETLLDAGGEAVTARSPSTRVGRGTLARPTPVLEPKG